MIIGATGLLGSIIYKRYRGVCQVFGTYFRSLDIHDKNLFYLDASDDTQLLSLIKELSPSMIINCMGLASVEACERNPED